MVNKAAPNPYAAALANHVALMRRQRLADIRIKNLRLEISKNKTLKEFNKLNVFAAGSLGRRDAGKNSDLDVFFTSVDPVTHIEEIKILSEIIQVGRALRYEEFSNDGQYLKVFALSSHEKSIGSPTDDQENWFTARMLLLLESQTISAVSVHHEHVKKVLNVYFRDAVDHQPFKPIFFLNDLKRFWATLCLNYEQARHRTSQDGKLAKRPWRKKNFNLKFSRLLSVFSMILPVLLEKRPDVHWLQALCAQSPLNRLAQGLDAMDPGGTKHLPAFRRALDDYEFFLKAKEKHDLEAPPEDIKNQLTDRAQSFHAFFVKIFTSEGVPQESFGYLLI